MAKHEYIATVVQQGVPEFLKGICEKEYIRCYNDVAIDSEKRYAAWNEEYDKTFGKQEDYDNSHYNDWFSRKLENYINENNDSNILTFTVGREDVDIVGHLKWIANSNISLYIREL